MTHHENFNEVGAMSLICRHNPVVDLASITDAQEMLHYIKQLSASDIEESGLGSYIRKVISEGKPKAIEGQQSK